MAYLPQNLIRKKRDGIALSGDELRFFVEGVSSGDIPDYQVSALLMAIFFRGMDAEELPAWADAMLHSGDVLDLSHIPGPKVDKHSTGGVGDKISLPLAPAVAACGVSVPMVSGRGLGHTGGTLDKLESIPGFQVGLSVERFKEMVAELGMSLIGQTAEIAPADKRLYALRDVTGTVESVPLIASSIMSKKLAEGIDALVLDCKVGHGAFMKDIDSARTLAKAIQVIGAAAGKPVTAVLSDMNAPIGKMVGNALEVRESIEVLHGKGPRDTRELTCVLGGEMLFAAKTVASAEEGHKKIAEVLDNGKAAELFSKVIHAQGGDARVVEAPLAYLPKAKKQEVLQAPKAGWISDIAAHDLGVAGLWLGAGRRQADDDIDPAVGIELHIEVGTQVEKGQPLATIHHNEIGLNEAQGLLQGAIAIGGEQAPLPSRIIEVLRS